MAPSLVAAYAHPRSPTAANLTLAPGDGAPPLSPRPAWVPPPPGFSFTSISRRLLIAAKRALPKRAERPAEDHPPAVASA